MDFGTVALATAGKIVYNKICYDRRRVP